MILRKMEWSTGKLTSSAICENEKWQEPPFADVTSRLMVLLSQSQIRQQLECQVRYFLSWNLLNIPNNAGLGGQNELPMQDRLVPLCFRDHASLQRSTDVVKPFGHHDRIKKTLAFKATVSLVHGWLKAHDLIHSAGVLCPEVAITETEVMSQEECLGILRLPQSLLERPPLPAVASDFHCSLLDRLVAYAVEAASCATPRNSRTSVWKCDRNAKVAERTVSSAGECRDRLHNASICAARRLSEVQERTDGVRAAAQRVTRRSLKGISFSPSSVYKARQVNAFQSRASNAKSSKDGEIWINSAWWGEKAATVLQLLVAQLRRLEFHESSGRLLTANHDVKRVINKHLAVIENEHKSRIKRLKKALTQKVQTREAAQEAIEKTERKLQVLLRRHEETEAALGKRAREVADRESRLAETQQRLLSETLLKHAQESGLGRDERNKVLSEENANLRAQLLTANRLVELLHEQVQRQRADFQKVLQSQMADRQTASEHATNCMRPQEGRKDPNSQSSQATVQASTLVLEQDYEDRVARLTEELQRCTEQIRGRDAEFKLLVAELEYTRHKNAQAQKRAKKLQKWCEAARASRAQQRQLASSLSLTLNTLGLAMEPTADIVPYNCPGKDGTDIWIPRCDTTSFALGMGDKGRPIGSCKLPPDAAAGVPPKINSCEARGNCGTSEAVARLEGTSMEMVQHLQGFPQLSKSPCATVNFVEPPFTGLQNSRAIPLELTTLQPSHSTYCSNFEEKPGFPSDITEAANRMTPPRVTSKREAPKCRESKESVACPHVWQEYSEISRGQTEETRKVTDGESLCGSSRICLFPTPLHVADSSTDIPPGAEVACESALCTTLKEGMELQDQVSAAPLGRKQNFDTEDLSAATFPLAADFFHNTPSKAYCHVNKKREPSVSPRSAHSRSLTPSSPCEKPCPQELLQQKAAADKSRLAPFEHPAPQNSKSEDTVPEEFAFGKQHRNIPTRVVSAGAAKTQPFAAPDGKTQVACPLAGSLVASEQSTDPSTQVPEPVQISRKLEQAYDEFISSSAIDQTGSPPLPKPPGALLLVGMKRRVPASHETKGDGQALLTPPSESSCVAPSVPFRSLTVDATSPKTNTVEHRSPSAMPGSDENVASPPNGQTPWVDASFESSLPASPQGLSNFPSLSCPVAAAVEGFHAPNSANLEVGGCWMPVPKKRGCVSESAPSLSPSDNDWLACVSPSMT